MKRVLHNETVAPQLGEAPLGVSGVWETVGREGEKRVYAMRIGDRYTYREARISQSGVLIIVQGHTEKIGRPRARSFTGKFIRHRGHRTGVYMYTRMGSCKVCVF